jgi:hypothetical protein
MATNLLRDGMIVLSCCVYLEEHRHTLGILIQVFNKLVGIE